MTRLYPIPSHLLTTQAVNLVAGILEPFGGIAQESQMNPGMVIVAGDPLVLEVCDGAIRFELHEQKGCTCVACVASLGRIA